MEATQDILSMVMEMAKILGENIAKKKIEEYKKQQKTPDVKSLLASMGGDDGEH